MSLPTEPYTRIERYLAKLAGQDVDIPDKPITRIECYLDYLVNNGGGGTAATAGAHNSIFRGQSLGTSITTAQLAAIEAHTFDDMFVGDYWTIAGRVYRVAGFDLFKNIGDQGSGMTAGHVVIVPDNAMKSGVMNSEETTTGGYAGAAIRTEEFPALLEIAKTSFGKDHILSHRMLMSTGISSWAWTTATLELMSEAHVFGLRVWGAPASSGYNVGSGYFQFPLFTLDPSMICRRVGYWLSDLRNSTDFSVVGPRGSADFNTANVSFGIRPYFLVGVSS